MFSKKSTTLSPFYLLSVWYSASRVKINWSNNHLTVESELVSGSYRLFLLYRYSCHRVLKKRSSFLSPPRYDYYSFYLSICSFFFNQPTIKNHLIVLYPFVIPFVIHFFNVISLDTHRVLFLFFHGRLASVAQLFWFRIKTMRRWRGVPSACLWFF